MAGLDRERVVDTALQLLNDGGLEGLTLRRLAAELGVKAPALYWHFENKQALLDEMGTTILRRLVQQSPGFLADAPWQEYLPGMMRALRAELLCYRDGARVFSGTYVTDATILEAMEASLRRCVDAGFSLSAAVQGWTTIYNYTVGFVIEEQAIRPVPDAFDDRYAPETRAARIDASRFPLSVEGGRLMFGVDDDGRFEAGLELIVDGMEARLAGITHP
ncbi:MAG TPA: TetR/AcrR family transcriptional regulator C-terminal domain-containing protein [Thermomicrobiales bacterium]|nr:TetR/AcrR family transcriptional regulator C-terminal domain-containing protein [Thermomicrobiales bacterium]